MNAQPREIPIIDLFTGLPWVAEPVREPPADTAAAAETNGSGRSSRVRRKPAASGPRIAPHRFDDATALDLVDARESLRCRCRRRSKQRPLPAD